MHHFTTLVVLLVVAAPACDEATSRSDYDTFDRLTDTIPEGPADHDSRSSPEEEPGICTPTSNGVIEADMAGVEVFGTGHLGPESLRVEITTDVEIEFLAGMFFEPKTVTSSQITVKRPQRMMIAADVLLQGPGTYFIDANCMEYQQATPEEDSEFYSCPQEPTTPVQLCQQACGDDQSCVWGCQEMEDPVPTEYTTLYIISLYVTDNCDDNYPLVYRFFDCTSGEVWPETGTFETEGVGIKTTTEFTCTIGNTICLGGETNGNVIGVGLDGTGPEGEDWCFRCGLTWLTGWELGCG